VAVVIARTPHVTVFTFSAFREFRSVFGQLVANAAIYGLFWNRNLVTFIKKAARAEGSNAEDCKY
jgi:hypothetical protein